MTTIAILATLDTKADEAAFMRDEIMRLGGTPLLVDVGVMKDPSIAVDLSADDVARAGGSTIAALRASSDRQQASPVLIGGATKLLRERIDADALHGVVALGGTQGTSNWSQVLQALPYGFPKVMLSTVASGDTAPFVGIKDVTMMFSVADILGLNPFTRKILSNAAAATWGMAQAGIEFDHRDGRGGGAYARGTIAMTNLGVLTDGAMHAIDRFHEAGYEVITFHAIGAGGRAMEQMMKEGLIDGVFDYALGEIADELFDGLRAATPERLTVAASLGIPQVIVPGGAEHIGVLLHEPNTVPERWKDHAQTFHNPYVFVPRLRADEMRTLAAEIGKRLASANPKPGTTTFLMPLQGVSRYSSPGAVLEDRAADAAFWEQVQTDLPAAVEREAIDATAEADAFVDTAVDRLLAMLNARASG